MPNFFRKSNFRASLSTPESWLCFAIECCSNGLVTRPREFSQSTDRYQVKELIKNFRIGGQDFGFLGWHGGVDDDIRIKL